MDERPGRPIDPHRALLVLRRARLPLAVALLLGGAVGFALSQWGMPRAWLASASLVYEGVPEVAGLPSASESDLPTLVDSVKLPANLERVRERLQSADPLDDIGRRVTVTVEENSNVMNLAAEAASAQEAAALANAMMAVFLEHRMEVERTRLSEHMATLADDIRVGREGLEEARRRYDVFRNENGIADLTTEHQQAIETAAQLQAGADLARTDAQAEDARLRQLRQAVGQQRRTVVTEVQSSPEAVELARVRSELAQAAANLSDEHPRVQALRQQVAALEARTAAASHTVTDRTVSTSAGFEALQGSVQGSAANREAARQREESLQTLAAAARERLERLSAIEGQASTLLAAVTVADAHVLALEGRRRAVEDALRSPSAGFRIVSDAVEPEYPVPSKTRWVAAGAVPLVLALLVLVFFATRELRGLKVITALEVGYWGRGPVIGATTWPAHAAAIHELVSELDDFVPDARGVTLVVGATEAEEKLATQLADRLRDDWQPTSTIEVGDQPVVGYGSSSDSTKLALRPSEALAWTDGQPPLEVSCYAGPHSGPKLRRAVRLADRVIVVVPSGRYTAMELSQVRERLGRVDGGVAFLVVGLDAKLTSLPDRTGDVGAFWLDRTRTANG